MLSRRWEMLRWITNFIDEHKDSWEEERKMKEEEAYKELEEWNRFKRFEKIKHLQKKWRPEQEEKENNSEKIDDGTNWKEWRVDDERKDGIEIKEPNLSVPEENNTTPGIKYTIKMKEPVMPDQNRISSSSSKKARMDLPPSTEGDFHQDLVEDFSRTAHNKDDLELIEILEHAEQPFLDTEDQKQGDVEVHTHVVVEHSQKTTSKDNLRRQPPKKSKDNLPIKKFPALKHPKKGETPEAKRKNKKAKPNNDKTQRKITDLFKPNMNKESELPNDGMKRTESSKDAQSSAISESSDVAALISEGTEIERSRSFQNIQAIQTCPDLGESSNLISLFNDSLV